VDDEPFNLVALEGLLGHLSIERIDKALNGRDALEIVKKNPETYDMVITDNQMPHMIGIDLARHIRLL
jgi:YesN/AraC family two-component response regulator